MSLEELKKAKEEYEAKKKEKGEAAIKAELKGFFEKFPEVACITWTQGTPSFNDGDPCYFSVHEPRVILKDEDDDEEERDSYDLREKNPALAKAVDEIYSTFESLEDVLEDVFGNGSRVKVEADGKVDIDDYYD